MPCRFFLKPKQDKIHLKNRHKTISIFFTKVFFKIPSFLKNIFKQMNTYSGGVDSAATTPEKASSMRARKSSSLGRPRSPPPTLWPITISESSTSTKSTSPMSTTGDVTAERSDNSPNLKINR